MDVANVFFAASAAGRNPSQLLIAIGTCAVGILCAWKPQTVVSWLEKSNPAFSRTPKERRDGDVRLVGFLMTAAGIFYACVWFHQTL